MRVIAPWLCHVDIDVSTQKRTFPLKKRLCPSINVPMIASVHHGNKDPFPSAEEEDRHPNARTMRMHACGAQPRHRFAWEVWKCLVSPALWDHLSCLPWPCQQQTTSYCSRRSARCKQCSCRALCVQLLTCFSPDDHGCISK